MLLAGDTDYRPWKEKILPSYGSDVKSSILLASHHGSIGFFDDPSDTQRYYTAHIEAIAPAMTLGSVGPNQNNLPDAKALKLYEKYSSGSDQGKQGIHYREPREYEACVEGRLEVGDIVKQ